MRYRFVRSGAALAACLALLAFPTTGAAKTPSEVLQPYKAYKAALASGNLKAARKSAGEALDAAEASGVSDELKATLTHNLAQVSDTQDVENIIDLYKQAIALQPVGDDSAMLNAERHVMIGQQYIYNPDYNAKHRSRMRRDVRNGLDYVESNGLLQSTLGAEMLAIDGVVEARYGDRDDAVSQLDRALAIFESDAHTLPSTLRYQAYLLKGSILNLDDKPIEAALALQVVMQNLEGDVPKDHPFIQSAFNKWLHSRTLISERNATEQALEAGVCKCWPYDELSKNAPVPVVRVPPAMPRRAKRSGHVMVRFDIAEGGVPVNIEPISTTSKVFVKPAVESVSDWRYDDSQIVDQASRQGVITRISFRLANERGVLIPELDDIIILDEAGYAQSQSFAQ